MLIYSFIIFNIYLKKSFMNNCFVCIYAYFLLNLKIIKNIKCKIKFIFLYLILYINNYLSFILYQNEIYYY